jgi:hypothetical protein
VPNPLVTARRAPPNEDTDEYARRSGQGIRQAEEPRRNFVYASSDGYPAAEQRGRENDPPATRKKSDSETASEGYNEDHRSFLGDVAFCLDGWSPAGSASGDIPAHWPSRAIPPSAPA